MTYPTSTEEIAGTKEYVEYPQPRSTDSPQTRADRLIPWIFNNVFYTNLRRLRLWAEWRIADLFHDGHQTGIAPVHLGYAGHQLSQYFPPDSLWFGDDMPPRPVLNEYKDLILNEAARLDRSDYEPTVRPEGDDPSYSARLGAKVATRALRSRLHDLGWEQKKDQIAYHMPSYGGAWIVSYWDRSMDETVRLPKEGCLACPACSFRCAGPLPDGGNACPTCPSHMEDREATEDEIAERVRSVPPLVEGQEHPPELLAGIQAPVSVEVPGGPPLVPFTPKGPELRQRDPFGREFGEDAPLGQWCIDIPWPGDVFEANLGVATNGDVIVRDVTLVRVRDLDWVRARYPNARTELLEPEPAVALMAYHPVGGEFGEADTGHVFRHAVRVVQRIKFPWMERIEDSEGRPVRAKGPDGQEHEQFRLNRGRVATCASGLVLEDTELMEDGPDGLQFPKVSVEYVPHDVADGGQRREGSSMARQLFDPQRGINWSVSMDVDEQRNGQSRWLASDSSDVRFENADGTSMGIVRYALPEGAPDPSAYVPRLVSRPTEAVKWGGMSRFMLEFMDRASRRTEVEGGQIPGPTTAATALQISREESSEVRKPRIARLARAYERTFRHGLQLMQRYVREPRVAWDRTDSKREFQSWWMGADFHNQTDVRIDVEGAADTDLLRQTKIDGAVEQGLVDLTNPRQRRVIGRLKGLPADLYSEEDEQQCIAEREFSRFTAKADPDAPKMLWGAPPVVDDGLDNHLVHVDQHTRDLHSDLWRQVEERVSWDAVLVAIGGWKQELARAMQPPMPPQPPPVPGPDGQLMPPPPAPPPGPPSVDLLMPTPERAILGIWCRRLLDVQADPALPQDLAADQQAIEMIQATQPDLYAALCFRAHLAEHKLRLAMEMTQAAQAAPAAAPQIA